MKSKLLSRALAVAASAAMLATMATSAFAAAGTDADILIGDSSVSSKSVTVGSSFVAEASIYYGTTNYSDDVDADAVWDVVPYVTATVSFATTGSSSTLVTDTDQLAALAAVTSTTGEEISYPLSSAQFDVTDFVSVSKVAGTDGKSVKVAATDAPEATDVAAVNSVEYKVDETHFYTITYTAQVPVLKLRLVGTYSSNSDTDYVTLSITDNRFILNASGYVSGTTVANTAFDITAIKAANSTTFSNVTVDDDVVTDVNIGTKTQVTYKLLQAIYNQEEAVDIVAGDFTFTVDGLNMSSIGSSATDANVMTLSVGTGRLSRTTRNNIAEASKEYGADFAVAVASDPDDAEYFPLDLSDITVPDAVGSVAITFDPDEVYEGGDLADFAADGELYMYLYDDGEFTLFDTVATTGRRDSLLTFEMEDGDQGLYILTTTKLEKGAASSSSSAPASSTPASSTPASSETIPNTGDANVVAIAVMMAVIALGGAAVVAKKATK